jgi:hypothetical protein
MMSQLGLSTIAQLLFADGKTIDFARIVSELDSVLTRLRGKEVTIAWDCDDLVTFDMPDTRIVLAWAEVGTHRSGGALTVSVGPGFLAEGDTSKSEHDILCSRLVERILTRFEHCAVLWCQIDGPVDADMVDELTDAVPEMATSLPPVESILDTLTKTDLQIATKNTETRRIRSLSAAPPTAKPKPAKPPEAARPSAPAPVTPKPAKPAPIAAAANDRPHLPRTRNAELARVRQALYPPEVAPETPVYSTQMRLAVHCLNATLIVVWPPLGAAVMTYSVLRGENMQMSARLMAVAGTFFAIAHSPIGQGMMAMARDLA